MNSVLDGPTLKIPNGGMSSPTLAVSRGRGFQASSVNFGPAPQINGRGFLAGRQGAMAIGQGLQDLGGSLGQISAHAAQAVNVRRIAEAGITTSAAQLDIAKAQAAEPDPNKWEGNARKMVGDITKGLVQNSDSPAVRQAIELHALEWGTNVIGQSKIAAYQKQFSDAGQTLGVLHGQQIESGDFAGAAATRQKMTPYVGPGSMEALRLKEVGAKLNNFHSERDTALNDGNIPKAKDTVHQAFASGLINEKKRDLELSHIEAVHTSKQEADQIQALIINDPVEAQKALGDPDKFAHIPPGDRAAMMVNAKQVQATYATDIFKDSITRIGLGQVKSEEKFDGEPFRQLTPLMRDVLIAHNADRTKKNAMNDMDSYEMARAGIAKYDPAKDEGGLGKANLSAALIGSFSGPYLQELQDRLEKKSVGQKGTGLDADPALALLGEWTDGGGLGEYKVPMKSADGADVMTEPKKIGITQKTKSLLGVDWLWPDSSADEMSQSKPVTVEDPSKKAQAGNKQATIRKQIEAELRNGKFKTNDEITARMLELFQQQGGKVPAQPFSNPLLPSATEAEKDMNAELQLTREIINYKK